MHVFRCLSTNVRIMSLYKVKWSKVLSTKKHGGLGVSSFYALNGALLFKWVWRYISQDNSLWARVISSIHGSKFQDLVLSPSSLWISIVREVRVLKSRAVDLVSYCKKRVGNRLRTSFWEEVWIGDNSLSSVFPRIFALENNKSCSVADKLHDGLVRSLRRQVRGGVESQQLSLLHDLISSTLLSNVEDRWVWNLNGSGLFRVSDIRNLVDETFLPKDEVATRWIKYIPIKINIFAWKVRLDRLPTRLNLVHRGVQVTSLACPVCSTSHENTSHILFSCSMASDIARLISRWWDLGWSPLGSYAEWLSWFKDIRMGSKLKSMLQVHLAKHSPGGGNIEDKIDMVLKQRYHRLYALEVKKTVDVASKLSQENLTWSFRRAPRSGVEQDQLTTYVEGVVLGVTPDRWYWTKAVVKPDLIYLPEISWNSRVILIEKIAGKIFNGAYLSCVIFGVFP
ncbi:RNA-directed DNA polymerase, eukaryota [Tanacetum coccineum]